MILHSKILGESSRTLIILHGLFGSLDNWFAIGKELSSNFQVHLVDLRNHGKSFHSSEYNYQLMSKDLYHYIQFYQIHKPTIIGHSMGGKVAMLFSINYSAIMSNLIVIDIAPKQYKNEHKTIINALGEISKIKLESRKKAEEILSVHRIAQHKAQFLLKNLFWNKHQNLVFRFNLNVIKSSIKALLDFPSEFDTVKVKTHFIRGENSNYITEEDYKYIREKFSNSTLIDIFDAGHWVHFDQKQKIIDTIKQILL